MKKAWLLAMAFLVSIPLGLFAQSASSSDGYYAASFARVTFVNGDVFVQRAPDLGTERAEVNLALVKGDKLGTGAGQAEVDFGRRNYLRLDNNSKVEFAVLPVEGNDLVKIHVLEGSAYLRVSSLAGEKSIEVHSPDVSCYILDEGLYRFNVGLNNQTEILVTEGSLEAAGAEGSVVVNAGQSVAAEDGRLLGEPGYFNARSDGFDQWNASRDSLLAQRSTTRYLPSDIDEYQEELDHNGHWTYEQPYGYVWIPYGIGDDWRPYMYGHWCWYPVIGWTWISSEPWGWSVYHYGRWHWRFGLGWYWIPHNCWGPAWVHWWWDNDYIGWCPLSWYNRPVVIINNRFYDRYYDRDRFFPGNNRAMSVIRRDQLQAHDIGRNVLRAGELHGIDHVALRPEQPAIRPSIGRSSLQSPEAQKIFSARPGIRGEAKNYAPGNTVTASRLRSPNQGSGGRTTNLLPSSERGRTDQGRALRPGSSQISPAERNIHVYPRSPSVSASGQTSPGRDRTEGISRSPRSIGNGSGDSSARVYPSRRDNPSPSRTEPSRSEPSRSVDRQKGNESKSSGSQVKSSERIKSYPSSTRAQSYAPNARISSSAEPGRLDSSFIARTYPSRMARDSSQGYSTNPSRLSSGSSSVAGSSSGRPRVGSGSAGYAPSSGTLRSYPAPSQSSSYSQARRYDPRSYSYSRPSSPSYSRSSAPRYSAPSQSRGSYSSPSRSSGSSSHSSSSSSRSSSSGRSSGARRKS